MKNDIRRLGASRLGYPSPRVCRLLGLKPTDRLRLRGWLTDADGPVWRHVRLRATGERIGGFIGDGDILPHPSAPYDREAGLREIMKREA
jgi:hypothetical protein